MEKQRGLEWSLSVCIASLLWHYTCVLQVAAEPLLCSQTRGGKEEGTLPVLTLTCMCTRISLFHSWMAFLTYFRFFLEIRETVAGKWGWTYFPAWLLVPTSLSSLVHMHTCSCCNHAIASFSGPVQLSIACSTKSAGGESLGTRQIMQLDHWA